MTYQEILDYIFSRGRFGIKPGLERINRLLERLGNPHSRFRAVQIAGTNGKGSTAAFLSSIMTTAGYRTGLYTSPHLVSFTERFRIDGSEISEERVAALAERVLAVAPDDATFFELVTAIAFLWFAEEEVDLAVIETGLGGRFDATNSIEGILAVITPVGLDHCEYLGDTLDVVAFEKAGIIKPGRPVVVSAQEPEAMQVIVERCHELVAPLFSLGDQFATGWSPEGMWYNGMHSSLSGVKPSLAGRFQSGNAAAAMAAAELLRDAGFTVGDDALRSGIERAVWPGRMELFPGPPQILLDGAHNEAGIRALIAALKDYPRERLILVAGFMADKKWQQLLLQLLPLAGQLVAVAPALERALETVELAAFTHCLGVDVDMAVTVADGVARACKLAGSNDLILVTGSLFTVGEARAFLTGTEARAIRG